MALDFWILLETSLSVDETRLAVSKLASGRIDPESGLHHDSLWDHVIHCEF
jgi:hypothetical protein